MTRPPTLAERVEAIEAAHAVDASGRCRRCQCNPASCDVAFLAGVVRDLASTVGELLTEPGGPA